MNVYRQIGQISTKISCKTPGDSGEILEKLLIMKINPLDANLDIKALQGIEKGAYRLRVGSYRFKYVIIEHEIVIYFYDAGSRGDIYK